MIQRVTTLTVPTYPVRQVSVRVIGLNQGAPVVVRVCVVPMVRSQSANKLAALGHQVTLTVLLLPILSPATKPATAPGKRETLSAKVNTP